MCCAAGSIFDLLNSDDRASWKAKASYWLEGIYATIAITVVVFFALFLDDFRQAVLPTSLDVSCEYISGLILVSLPRPQNWSQPLLGTLMGSPGTVACLLIITS